MPEHIDDLMNIMRSARKNHRRLKTGPTPPKPPNVGTATAKVELEKYFDEATVYVLRASWGPTQGEVQGATVNRVKRLAIAARLLVKQGAFG